MAQKRLMRMASQSYRDAANSFDPNRDQLDLEDEEG